MLGEIQVHRSHRLEHLADLLATFVERPLASPLAKEWIVVQGRGMALWLNMQLSERLGVWANPHYTYPKRFVRQVFSLVLGAPADDDSKDHYQPDALTWRVHSLLGRSASDQRFAELARYGANDPDGTRRFALSERIARCFDEYLTYRPEMLLEWEDDALAASTQAGLPRKGRESGRAENQQLGLFEARRPSGPSGAPHAWQRELWREVVRPSGANHIARLERSFHDALASGRAADTLPERISVFGLSNLPPQYVRVLASLSHACDVRLFQLSVRPAGDAAAEPMSKLVASCGELGFAFEHVLSSELPRARTKLNIEARTPEPAGTTLLARLQHALLGLTDRERSGVDSADASIRVHSCHSMIREVEVLHDQISALLDEGFAPDEVLVMMPNVDEYAPLVEAVFRRASDDPHAIPYRISDRKPQGGNPVLEAFLRVLMLAARRAAASEVLDLLTLGPVRERFGIEAQDLPTIARWVSDSGIRWGIDAEHKRRQGVPAEAHNSWRFGLDRLLVGYAADTDGSETVLGVLPYEHIEGRTGELLGRFVEFAEALFSSLGELEAPRSIEAWQRALSALLARMVERTADNAWQHQHLLSVLANLGASARAAAFDELASLEVVRCWLEDHCEGHREAQGFLAGGVTFCALVPMRSIPFRALCILGMNDAEFPRKTQRVDFNLLSADPKARAPGDPDRRLDDRHLFLEALLSARERLIISYVGQSVRDNTVLAPSVVVTELLEELARLFELEPESLVTRHPLQPFSPRYFSGKERELFSYASSYLGGAQRMSGARKQHRELFPSRLPAPEGVASCELRALAEFFAGPSEYLFKQRLNVQVRGEHLSIKDREPVDLEPLEDYQLGANLLALRMRGVDAAQLLPLLRAGGQIPSFAQGELSFELVMKSVEPIAEAVQGLRAGEPLPAQAVELALPAVRLVGELDALYPAGRVVHQYARIKAKNLLVLWVHHLALCAQAAPGVEQESWLVGRPVEGGGVRRCRLRSVAGPLTQLRVLCELYALGQREPLPFFPEASLALASALADPHKERNKALFEANQAWKTELGYSSALGRIYGPETRLDWQGPEALPHQPSAEPIRAPLIGAEPFSADPTRSGSEVEQEPRPSFEALAKLVFDPLLAHLEEG